MPVFPVNFNCFIHLTFLKGSQKGFAKVIFEKLSGIFQTMLQVITRNGDREGRKAVMYLKERRIPFQLVNLDERKLSEREWESIFSSFAEEDLMDKESKTYKKNGYAYMVFDVKEKLMENPELLKLPILRSRGKCAFFPNEQFIKDAAE